MHTGRQRDRETGRQRDRHPNYAKDLVFALGEDGSPKTLSSPWANRSADQKTLCLSPLHEHRNHVSRTSTGIPVSWQISVKLGATMSAASSGPCAQARFFAFNWRAHSVRSFRSVYRSAIEVLSFVMLCVVWCCVVLYCVCVCGCVCMFCVTCFLLCFGLCGNLDA